MFGSNYLPENLEGYEQGFIPNEVSNYFLPGFENYNSDLFPKDFPNFPLLIDPEAMDPANFMQMFDQALQNLPEEMRHWLPNPFECMLPQAEPTDQKVYESFPKILYNSNTKIGTISIEERKIKVQKYLDKRKRRNFRKKISYMCRKNVADKRIRIKGRFVSKLQADAILGEKSNNSSEL